MSDPYDVVVVGGGLCGLLVAEALGGRGARVAVLEAGQRLASAPLDRARFDAKVRQLPFVGGGERSTGVPYQWRRTLALGGRTLHWGGWCDRPEALNLVEAAGWGAAWPLGWAALARELKAAERALGVRTAAAYAGHRALSKALGLKVTSKRGAVLPRGSRPLNAADLARGQTVRTGTTAVEVARSRSGAANGVLTTDAEGRSRVVRGRRVVLCASAVESARLVDGALHRRPSGFRHALANHLVTGTLALVPRPAPDDAYPGALVRASLVPRFVNRGAASRRPHGLGFTTEIIGPYSARHLDPLTCTSLGLTAADLEGASYLSVHALGEVPPHPKRFVRFVDADGRGPRIPEFQWAWTQADRQLAQDAEETTHAVADALTPPGTRLFKTMPALTAGIPHEAGTLWDASTREGLADGSGAVLGIRGLFVADGALMPTALDRHPSLALAALALHVARAVERSLKVADA